MRNWGDEEGLIWEAPIRVGKTSAGGSVPRERFFRKAAPPEHYELPTEFPQISRHPRIVIDIETKDPNLKRLGPGAVRGDGFIVGIGVRTDEWKGDYYPVRHKEGPNLDPRKVFEWLAAELRDYRGVICGANLLYEGQWLATEGVTFEFATIEDVQWAEPLLDENAHSYKLNAIAKKWLGMEKVKEEIIELYGDDFINRFDEVHPGHAKPYCMGDVDLPLLIIDLQKAQLEREGLTNLFLIESENYNNLLEMKQLGVRVDLDAANKFNDRLAQERLNYAAKIRYITGFDVDVFSADSVARAFDKIGATYPKTEKGKPSFRKEWLEAHPSELSEFIVAVRKCQKFKGTFIENYILKGHHNGRIHAEFHPLKKTREDGATSGTVSGRFSSSNPNLQNIPVRDEVFGPLIRGLFIPDEGTDWWSLDQSQMEYRLLVHYSVAARCAGAMEAARMYQNDPTTDFHIMAAELTGLPRKQAKNINFGIVYSMGGPTMASKLGISLKAARGILETYHGKMPFCREVNKMAANQASKVGYVRTILGRKRRFDLFEPLHTDWSLPAEQRPPAMHYDDAVAAYGQVKRAFTHKALNAVLQGSNADYTKMCMVLGRRAGLFGKGKPLSCALTVHDELDGCAQRTPEAVEAFEELKQVMMKAIPLKVPVLVDGRFGKNWQEAH